MKTLNNDLLCSIDTETTGLRAGYHDIIELALLPLQPNLEVNTEIPAFTMTIQPEKWEHINPRAMKVNKISKTELLRSPPKIDVLHLFDIWFNEQITERGYRQIQVLAQNWAFDYSFLNAFFGYYEPSNPGQAVMDDYLNLRTGVRDTKSSAKYINDLAELNGLPIAFAKTGLAYLCSQLNIQREQAHRALGDCRDTATVYKKLMFTLQGLPLPWPY